MFLYQIHAIKPIYNISFLKLFLRSFKIVIYDLSTYEQMERKIYVYIKIRIDRQRYMDRQIEIYGQIDRDRQRYMDRKIEIYGQIERWIGR